MSVLLLVNNAVFATSDLEKACLPNVSFLLYDPINDTYASLLEKIAVLNISSFSEVGIVFDESFAMGPTVKLLSSQLVPSILADVEVTDPTLSSWSEFSAFLGDLANIYSMKTLDFFACSLYSNLSWQYVFNTLDYRHGILIQASTDMTGNVTSGANWIMESDGVNIRDVYFNADILMYPFVFGASSNMQCCGYIYNGGIICSVNTPGGSSRAPCTISWPNIDTPIQLTVVCNGSANWYMYVLSSSGNVYYLNIPSDGTSPELTMNTLVSGVPTGKTAIKLSSGSNYCVLVLFSDGSIYGIGHNDGAMGNGLTDASVVTSRYTIYNSVPMTLPTNNGIVSFDVGAGFSLVIYKNTSNVNTVVKVGTAAVTMPSSTGSYYPIIAACSSTTTAILYSNGTSTVLYLNGTVATSLLPTGHGNITGVSSVVGVVVVVLYADNTLWCYSTSTSGPSSLLEFGVTAANTSPYRFLQTSAFPTGYTTQTIISVGLQRGIYVLLNDYSMMQCINTTSGTWSVTYTANASIGKILPANPISTVIVPSAPTLGSVNTSTNNVYFTANSIGAALTTNYAYSFDSVSWTTLSPTQMSSPLNITIPTNALNLSLQAINYYGYSAQSNIVNFAQAPSAPTSLVVSAAGVSGQVSVAFTASSNNGSAISNYKYSTDGTNFTAFSPAQPASPVTIAGLTNGTPYTLYLEAVNSAGSSVASVASGSITPYTNPSAPTSLVVSAAGVSGQVSVAFTAPSSDGGSAITNYKYSIDDGATFIALSPVQTSNPLLISGLTNGTVYTVLLEAVNAAGDSLASSASSSVTPYTNPDAPTSLIASASNAQISVAFTSSSSNGSEIIDYLYSIDAGATFTSLAQTSNPLIITGLTNGNLYTVYLEAVNAAGASDSSSASNSVTPQIRPTVDPRYTIAPPAPTLSTSGLIISVTAGMFNGSITTNYQWSTDNSTWISMSPVQTITPFTLIPSGLTAGSDYTIYIRAINLGFVNGLSASISISVPMPTYVAPVVTISAVEITAGSIGSAVTTVTASLGTTLTAGALANSNVLSVNLSAATNITSIPEGTFSGSALTSIILPNTITSIGSNAFAGCLLETIIIPASVTTISSGAFTGCPLTTIIIPASVTIIGTGAFQGTSLSSISLSSGTIIGEYALANCVSITQVSF